ncbi:hypothetical protein scyTo_0022991 [Scyliorhinus torazame]|uniref:Uncharacterized protein n=1 Tax=Scyliorhinus torazame TaxID=75743 RepID=A0A401Q7M4_SCYTO|nr:hypothetical protein [Scyliorhinus torazame]
MSVLKGVDILPDTCRKNGKGTCRDSKCYVGKDIVPSLDCDTGRYCCAYVHRKSTARLLAARSPNIADELNIRSN